MLFPAECGRKGLRKTTFRLVHFQSEFITCGLSIYGFIMECSSFVYVRTSHEQNGRLCIQAHYVFSLNTVERILKPFQVTMCTRTIMIVAQTTDTLECLRLQQAGPSIIL